MEKVLQKIPVFTRWCVRTKFRILQSVSKCAHSPVFQPPLPAWRRTGLSSAGRRCGKRQRHFGTRINSGTLSLTLMDITTMSTWRGHSYWYSMIVWLTQVATKSRMGHVEIAIDATFLRSKVTPSTRGEGNTPRWNMLSWSTLSVESYTTCQPPLHIITQFTM